jgi:hypothetical protein
MPPVLGVLPHAASDEIPPRPVLGPDVIGRMRADPPGRDMPSELKTGCCWKGGNRPSRSGGCGCGGGGCNCGCC